MKEERAIRVSMLIDGELSEQESSALLDEIEKDKELRDIWIRYQAASNLMRSEAISVAPSDFSHKVSLSLQAEPTVLSPKKRPQIRFDKTAVGAIAASVLVFAVMVGSSPDQPDKSPLVSPINTASNLPSLPARTPAGENSHVVQVAESDLKEEVWIQDERLNEYLMKHSEKTRSASAFGVLPFARVVGYGNAR